MDTDALLADLQTTTSLQSGANDMYQWQQQQRTTTTYATSNDTGRLSPAPPPLPPLPSRDILDNLQLSPPNGISRERSPHRQIYSSTITISKTVYDADEAARADSLPCFDVSPRSTLDRSSSRMTASPSLVSGNLSELDTLLDDLNTSTKMYTSSTLERRMAGQSARSPSPGEPLIRPNNTVPVSSSPRTVNAQKELEIPKLSTLQRNTHSPSPSNPQFLDEPDIRLQRVMPQQQAIPVHLQPPLVSASNSQLQQQPLVKVYQPTSQEMSGQCHPVTNGLQSGFAGQAGGQQYIVQESKVHTYSQFQQQPAVPVVNGGQRPLMQVDGSQGSLPRGYTQQQVNGSQSSLPRGYTQQQQHGFVQSDFGQDSLSRGSTLQYGFTEMDGSQSSLPRGFTQSGTMQTEMGHGSLPRSYAQQQAFSQQLECGKQQVDEAQNSLLRGRSPNLLASQQPLIQDRVSPQPASSSYIQSFSQQQFLNQLHQLPTAQSSSLSSGTLGYRQSSPQPVAGGSSLVAGSGSGNGLQMTSGQGLQGQGTIEQRTVIQQQMQSSTLPLKSSSSSSGQVRQTTSSSNAYSDLEDIMASLSELDTKTGQSTRMTDVVYAQPVKTRAGDSGAGASSSATAAGGGMAISSQEGSTLQNSGTAYSRGLTMLDTVDSSSAGRTSNSMSSGMDGAGYSEINLQQPSPSVHRHALPQPVQLGSAVSSRIVVTDNRQSGLGGMQSGAMHGQVGGLGFDQQGLPLVPKGDCGACGQPIVGQVLMALGKIWHIPHFICAHCKVQLGTEIFYEHDGLPYCERDYQNMFLPKCAHCNTTILEKCVTAFDQSWHPEHFRCAACDAQFGDEKYYEKDGRAYCSDDYFRMFAPTCGGCGNPIMSSFITALHRNWHPECFVCNECRLPFDNSGFYELNGAMYCERHFYAHRNALCASCNQPIVGRCVTALYRKYHPEHFVCTFCLNPLNRGTFKEQADKPYCHACFDKLFG